MISSEQIRAARALIRWEQKDLAEASGVSLPSIKRLEGQAGGLAAQARTIEALQAALEKAGIIFVAENGEGPGVRLKKQASHADLTKHIDAIKEHLKDAPRDEPPSPASGMRMLERGHKTEVLKKLKGRRAKLEKPS